jgi:hypothetical protein
MKRPSFIAALLLLLALVLTPNRAFAAIKNEPAKKPSSVPSAPRPAATPKPEIKLPFPAIGDSLQILTHRYGEGVKNAFKIRVPGAISTIGK